MTRCRVPTLTMTHERPLAMLDDHDLDAEGDIHPLFHGAPKSTEFRKLRKRLVQQVREAAQIYGMIRPGDRWLVCLSGGKDS